MKHPLQAFLNGRQLPAASNVPSDATKFWRGDGTFAAATGGIPLKVTFTGTPQTAIILATVPGIAAMPLAAVAGQATYTPAAGPHVAALVYTENATNIGPFLLTISFDDLVGVSGIVNFSSLFGLTSLAFPALVNVGADFTSATDAALVTLSAPNLVNVGGFFGPGSMASLTTLTLTSLQSVGSNFGPSFMASLATLAVPALQTVGGNFSPSSMASLTTLTLTNLKNVQGLFNPSSMASLASISLPAIATVGGNFSLVSMASLTTVSLPAMITYGGTIALNSALGSLASVTLGTPGTLKAIAGATINLSGQALPAAQVNAVLALLVSLSGTGGTTLWGAGKTLTINGGTNAAPSGQGITDKATLVARGATVTTN